jgi:hypothetical protein
VGERFYSLEQAARLRLLKKVSEREFHNEIKLSYRALLVLFWIVLMIRETDDVVRPHINALWVSNDAVAPSVQEISFMIENEDWRTLFTT